MTSFNYSLNTSEGREEEWKIVNKSPFFKSESINISLNLSKASVVFDEMLSKKFCSAQVVYTFLECRNFKMKKNTHQIDSIITEVYFFFGSDPNNTLEYLCMYYLHNNVTIFIIPGRISFFFQSPHT